MSLTLSRSALLALTGPDPTQVRTVKGPDPEHISWHPRHLEELSFC